MLDPLSSRREPDLLTVLALALAPGRPDHGREPASIPIRRGYPSVMAQQALTVNLISAGALKLGIGVTSPDGQ